MKRIIKTDEQLYIDWVKDVPEWLTTMPLNQENLDRYKATLHYSMAKMTDSMGVVGDELSTIFKPVIDALNKAGKKKST